MNDNMYEMPEDIAVAEKEAQELHQGRLDAINVKAYLMEEPKRVNVLVETEKMLRIIKAATANRESQLNAEIARLQEQNLILRQEKNGQHFADKQDKEALLEENRALLLVLRLVLRG